MGAKQSRLSEEDFLFLEEETGMSKATLQVRKFRPEHKMIKFRPEHKMMWSVQSLFVLGRKIFYIFTGVVCQLLERLPKWRALWEEVHPSLCSPGKDLSRVAFLLHIKLTMYIRVSQKNQKSEFCFATNPTGFHRLDEPPEKISAL